MPHADGINTGNAILSPISPKVKPLNEMDGFSGHFCVGCCSTDGLPEKGMDFPDEESKEEEDMMTLEGGSCDGYQLLLFVRRNKNGRYRYLAVPRVWDVAAYALLLYWCRTGRRLYGGC